MSITGNDHSDNLFDNAELAPIALGEIQATLASDPDVLLFILKSLGNDHEYSILLCYTDLLSGYSSNIPDPAGEAPQSIDHQSRSNEH